MKAVLMISHGSRSEKTVTEVRETLSRVRENCDIPIFEYAFLELQQPLIPEGITRCVEKGAREILILMNFLNAGRHVDQDIPEIVEESRKQYPGVRLTLSPPVGQHPGVIDLFQDMIQSNFNV